jgi:hypothetical protein
MRIGNSAPAQSMIGRATHLMRSPKELARFYAPIDYPRLGIA